MTSAQVEVNEQGRVTIPVAIRQQLGLRPGSRLIAHADEGRIVLEDRSRILAEYRARLGTARAAAGYSADESVADELIAERRAEASGEAAES